MYRFLLDHRLRAALAVMMTSSLCAGCSLLNLNQKSHVSYPSPAAAAVPTDTVDAALKESLEVPPSPADPSSTPEKTDSTAATPVAALDRDGRDLDLTLTDAVVSALNHNPHLRVLVDLPEEVGKRSEIERAQFDTSFNTNLQYLTGTQQVASALQAVSGGLSQYGTSSFGPTPGSPNLFSAEQRFSTGTTARVGLGSNYNFTSPIGQYLIYNPAYQSAGSLILEQALFRGRSREANLAGIRIAQTGQKQSAAEFQIEANQVLADVHKAYWTAWLSESQLQISEELVEQSQATWELVQKRFELGEGSIVQTAQATENLHSLKAELAQAKQRVKTARNQLCALMGISANEYRRIKMTEEPQREPANIDLPQGLIAAIQQRPEISVRQLQISQAQLELERRQNNELPDIRAYAGYSLTGLNNNFMGSINRLTTAEFGNWSMGVRYTYLLGRRAERAAVEQARLALSRQMRARQETEFLIQQQVREAYDGIQTSWDVWQSQQERVAAAEIQAETFHQLYLAGQIDLDRLLRARQQQATAKQHRHQALIDFNLALNSWRHALGEMTSPRPVETKPAPLIAKTSGETPATNEEEGQERIKPVEELFADDNLFPLKAAE